MGAVNQMFQGVFSPHNLSLAVQNKLVFYIYTLDTCLEHTQAFLLQHLSLGHVSTASNRHCGMHVQFIRIKFILDKFKAQTSLKYLYIHRGFT